MTLQLNVDQPADVHCIAALLPHLSCSQRTLVVFQCQCKLVVGYLQVLVANLKTRVQPDSRRGLHKILFFKFRFVEKKITKKSVPSWCKKDKKQNKNRGFWPVHPVAACGCRGAPSSAVYSPPSGYKYYLQSQTADISTQSVDLNRKTNKLNKQYSIAKHWKTQRKQRMLQFSFVWEAPTNPDPWN